MRWSRTDTMDEVKRWRDRFETERQEEEEAGDG